MIEVNQLTKTFDTIEAVKGVSFTLERGEVLGFLGPNGAGKSTTMKMLSCFLDPTSGTAQIGGAEITEEPMVVREKIGYVPENAPLYEELLVKEFMVYMAELKGIPKKEKPGAIDRVMRLCALEKVMNRPIETLSKGYKRRVSLAQAIIHDPEVLILDEPTDGLDPNQKHDVRELIKKLSKDKCIILSTHILEEVTAVCTRAIIINEGKVEFNGTPKELANMSSSGRIEDVFRVITTKEKVEGVTL